MAQIESLEDGLGQEENNGNSNVNNVNGSGTDSKQKPAVVQYLKNCKPSKDNIHRFFAYFHLLFSLDYTKTDVFLIISGVISGIAAGIPFPLLGVIFGQLINDLNSAVCDSSSTSAQSGNPDVVMSEVRKKVLYVIYITIANFCFIYVNASCWSLISERLARRYRRRYFESVIKQETGFIESLPSGDVVSRLASDIEVVQSGTSEKVGLVISTLSYFVTSYIIAFIKVPVITGMLVSIVPCFMLMSLIGGHYVKKYSAKITEHINAATSIASSSLSHLMLVHAFNANDRLETLFARHLSQSRMDALKKAGTHALQIGLLYLIAYSADALAFWEGARLIAKTVENGSEGVSVGSIYTVLFMLIDSSFILSQMAPFVHVFAAAAGASERLLEVISRQSSIDGTSEEGIKAAEFDTDDIEFRDVHFNYPSRPDVPVLQGINFTIPPKKHTAIVGPSGGGKSTIVSLLERFYDPSSGDVFTGPHKFRDLNVRYLRGNIGFVQQEPSLLDRSILENIAYGLTASAAKQHQRLAPFILHSTLPDLVEKIRQGTSEDAALAGFDECISEIVRLVKQAAVTANALDFIQALPYGLATNVGTSGNQLSGGQKQQIALARALIRQPRLLILDEATAALDSTSEQLIQEALSKISETITIVSIAHRLATAKDAHNIVVIQRGKVVEQGSHADLVAQGGAYAEMVRLQNLGRSSPASTVQGDSINTEFPDEQPAAVSEKEHDVEKDALLGFAESACTDETAAEVQPSVEKKQVEDKDEKKNGNWRKGPQRSGWFTTKYTFSLARPNLHFILAGLVMSVLIGGSYTAEAVIFGHTVGSLSPCRGAASILHSGNLYGLLFFILALVKFSANVGSGCAFGWAAEKILYRVRVLSLRSLLGQTIPWHSLDDRTPGTLITYITNDASALSQITGTTIGLLLAIAVNLVSGLVVSFVFAWRIAIVLLPTIPILLAAGMMKLRVMAKFAERHRKAFAHATAITVEAVDNIRAVAAFSLEKQSYQVYSRALKAPYRETMTAIAWGNIWLAVAFSISNLVYALAYWWGSKQIVEGRYSQTQFFIVLPALLFSTQACGQMFALAPDISKASVAVSNIVGLLTTNSAEEEFGSLDSVQDENGKESVIPSNSFLLLKEKKTKDVEAYPTSPVSNSADMQQQQEEQNGIGVQLRDVHFTYPSRPERLILKGLSIDIKPGQFCALVGPSGSGKSTTFAMLERFYRPTSGKVIIDGVDITKHLDTSFRDSIALVPQENVLFEGTVASNIALGARPGHEPTQAEIEAACRMANIHDAITSLPNGYETMCSHDGKQFSGGQRQRLSIARALVRKPRLLLLDESTSALDAGSEKRVQEALAGLAGRTTVVAIAHRLSTVHCADCIFLVEDGRCVGFGTHGELVARSETYRRSVVHQSLEL